MTRRLLLLRHGEVSSHRGDVAVTDRGLDSAELLGRRLATTAGRIGRNGAVTVGMIWCR